MAAISLVSCDEDEPAPAFEAERTVVVYMMAENSLSSYVQSDINEMRAVSTEVPDNMNFVISQPKRESPRGKSFRRTLSAQTAW